MSELFFPALEALPPAHPQPLTVAAGELGSLVMAQRSRFQRGLLSWLRGDAAAVEEMSAALLDVERTQSEPHKRVFWWIAGGLVDCVKSSEDAPPAELKKLFSRIDRQFARLAGGEPHVAEQLLRDMLYWISQSRTELPRPCEIQHHYNLLQSTGAGMSTQSAARELERVRADVDSTHAAWVAYIKDGRDLPGVCGRLRALPEVVAPLQNVALNGLSNALDKAAASLQERIDGDPELANEIGVALEVASSLLASLGAPAQQLVDLAGTTSQQLTRQLVQARQSHASSSAPAATVPSIDQPTLEAVRLLDEQGNVQPEHLLIEVLAREMVANLNRAEHLLEQFFGKSASQGVLTEVERLMAQIHGGLELAVMSEAAALLARCRQLVGGFTKAGHAASEEVEAMAEALSSLDALLRAAETGEISAAAITAMQSAHAPEAAPAVPTVERQIGIEVDRSKSLLQSWDQTPQTPEARTELKEVLEHIHEDAQLVGDVALEEQASKTLVMLAASDQTPSLGLVESIMTMGLPLAVPTPAVALRCAGKRRVDRSRNA